ncbi:MAG: TetR/AcrR family transcriptional regulator [Acidimicrobiales bacterium]
MTAEPSTRSVEPDPTDDGRRDRKKRLTRDGLIEAAAELFATTGFDETTTNDIAEAADVSQRTLFRHFPTKEALLYGDMDELKLELRRAFAERPADEAILDVVRHAMLTVAADFDTNRERRLLQVRLAAATPSVSAHSRAVVQAQWEREIIAAVAARLGVDPVADPRPEIIAGAAMSAIRVATRQWTAGGGTDDFTDLADGALSAIADL